MSARRFRLTRMHIFSLFFLVVGLWIALRAPGSFAADAISKMSVGLGPEAPLWEAPTRAVLLLVAGLYMAGGALGLINRWPRLSFAVLLLDGVLIFPAILIAAAVAPVGVFDDARLGRVNRAIGNLLLDFPQLILFQPVAVLGGIVLRLRNQDRAFQLGEHFGLGELVEHHELRLGRFQVLLGFLDREAVRLELQLVDVAFRRQLLAVGEVLLGPVEILLGHEHFALDRLPLLEIGAFQVFPFGNHRRVVRVLGLDFERLGGVGGDLLRGSLGLQRGRIELDQEVARVDLRALRHNPQDGDAGRVVRFDLRADFGHVERFDFAALGDVQLEIVAGNRVEEVVADGRFAVVLRPPPDAAAGGRQQHEHRGQAGHAAGAPTNGPPRRPPRRPLRFDLSLEV